MSTKSSTQKMHEEGYAAYLAQREDRDPNLLTYSQKDLITLFYGCLRPSQKRDQFVDLYDADYANKTKKIKQWIRAYELDSFFFAQNRAGTFQLTRLRMLVFLFLLFIDYNSVSLFDSVLPGKVTTNDFTLARNYNTFVNARANTASGGLQMVAEDEIRKFHQLLFDFVSSPVFKPEGSLYEREKKLLGVRQTEYETRNNKRQIEHLTEKQLDDFRIKVTARMEAGIFNMKARAELHAILDQYLNDNFPSPDHLLFISATTVSPQKGLKDYLDEAKGIWVPYESEPNLKNRS